MNKIPVNLAELGNALDDHGGHGEHRWYLDLRNGELILVSEFADLPEDCENLDAQPEVFLSIEPRSSAEGFAVMEDFVESLPDGEARRALARALRPPKSTWFEPKLRSGLVVSDVPDAAPGLPC